jgi:hypothetical protein
VVQDNKCVDNFLENQIGMEESKEPGRFYDDSPIDINGMIAQYNAHQPDFGQKMDPRQEEWIDPSTIISSASKKPFQIKTKTKNYKGVASGSNALNNNRAKLEQDRRQMLQYNIGGQRPPSGHEEEKKGVAKKPPRGTSSNNRIRHQPKSLRSNKINYSSANDNSMMNISGTSHNSQIRVNKSNRVTPP